MKDTIVKILDWEEIQDNTELPLIAIYDHPRDYPNHFVARVFDLDKPLALVALADTLEDIRAVVTALPVSYFPRSPMDDPCIVEVWI